MAQNRPPPAYQEFAAAMLASIHFRMLSPAERGLLWTMRMECWVNHALPKCPAQLARVLGFPEDVVAAGLPMLANFFNEDDGLLICPELENYRAHLAGIRAKQAAGGKEGAAKTNGKRKPVKTSAVEGIHEESGNSRVTRSLTRNSLVHSSLVQLNKTQSLEGVDSSDPWLGDYERASNGV